METVIRNARIIRKHDILSGDVKIKDGVLTEVGGSLRGARELDAQGQYLAPGFVDLHTHGGGGFDFLDGTEEAFAGASRFHAQNGTTTLLPTFTSSDPEELREGLQTYMRCKDRDLGGAHMPGVHLEGPYFSPKQGGAQDPRYMRGFDPAEYQALLELCPDILRWSVAPELPGAEEFAKAVRARGILLSVAHSDATYQETALAREWGFSHMTHLYSCMATVSRRNAYRCGGVLEAAYLFDDITVEIIADGCHLPPELLKFVMKFKGRENTALVTDSMSSAGMPEGPGFIGSRKNGRPVIIEDGVAKVPDRSCFAGSVATTQRLVQTMVKLAEVSIVDAVYMASTVPSRIQGLTAKGSIEVGKDADLVLLDDDLNVTKTILMGRELE